MKFIDFRWFCLKLDYGFSGQNVMEMFEDGNWLPQRYFAEINALAKHYLQGPASIWQDPVMELLGIKTIQHSNAQLCVEHVFAKPHINY